MAIFLECKYCWICPKILLKIHNPVIMRLDQFLTPRAAVFLCSILTFDKCVCMCVCVFERECVWLTTSHLLKLIALRLYASLNTTTLYCYNALTITAIKPGRITPCHCSSELQHTQFSGQWHYTRLRVVKTLSLLCKVFVMFWC